ncbi:hypothetical protein Pse7367_1823 [Thalassoporum mexicanum PCC 7367]|uniref:surface-adhesin E family protein n=1 Tax=Thalassoporum mexicanum TaxID=3457544 RepID=UPI00029F8B2A|nr:surface-adhesin E family protein [Pseudanabaena sp. PCC 7367]AFY70099.1 hypothetical protein Pse7367_1823 [Pseudanabaena sp. PCC 7367]
MAIFCNQNLNKKISRNKTAWRSQSNNSTNSTRFKLLKPLVLLTSALAGLGLFMAIPKQTVAIELVPIVETEAGVNQYINADTISHLGEIAEYEVYTKLPSPHVQGLATVRTLVTGNCESGETTSWGVVAFDADGQEILNKKFASGENHGKVKPGSIEERALILACEYPKFFPF